MPSPTIPDHTLLRPIGRGAYGEVWLARNIMGALRAVKIIARAHFESERPYEREFAGIRRYEPVSRSSGGLVHVLHVGRNDAEGYFYYVMELADDASAPPDPAATGPRIAAGPDLAGVIQMGEEPASRAPHAVGEDVAAYVPRTLRLEMKRSGPIPSATCVRIALDIARGLEQLHNRGLVHRDVKPGNIIFIDGRAKLADIGLVAAESEGRTVVGTEGYIPPEGPGAPSADLYALGIALYEASTGLPPHRFPEVPADWFERPAPDERFELHEIVLQACESQRDRRYATAQQLLADLALLQSGQSIRHLRQLRRRYAQIRIFGICAAALMALALFLSYLQNDRARLAARNQAVEAVLRRNAERAEKEARQQLALALLEQARATVLSGELGHRERALEAVRRAAAITNSPALRSAALSALALPDWHSRGLLKLPSRTTLAQLDPRFERIAVVQRSGPVEVFSVPELRSLAQLPASTNAPCHVGAWSPSGRYLALKRDLTAGGQDADIEVWDLSGPTRCLLLRNAAMGLFSFHPTLDRILATTADGGVAVYDLGSGREIHRIRSSDPITALRYSPEGDRVAWIRYAQESYTAEISGLQTGEVLSRASLKYHSDSIEWHPDGRMVAVADDGGGVSLVDASSGTTHLLGTHKAQATRVLFDRRGDYLLSAGWEREFILWDLRERKRAAVLGLDSYHAQQSADGLQYAVVVEGSVRLFDFERPFPSRGLTPAIGRILFRAAFSPDNRYLAASADQAMGLWDLRTGKVSPPSVEGADARMLFTPGGELWESAKGRSLHWRIREPVDRQGAPALEAVPFPLRKQVTSLALGADGVVAVGKQGAALFPFDASTNAVPAWHPSLDGQARMSPDGRWLAVFPDYSERIQILRLPEFTPTAYLTNSDRVANVEFCPWGSEVAVLLRKGVQIWRTGDWTRSRFLGDATNFFYDAHPHRFWVVQGFRSSSLCDADTLEPLLPLPAGTVLVAVSRDGQRLANVVDGRNLEVWDRGSIHRQLVDLGLDWGD